MHSEAEEVWIAEALARGGSLARNNRAGLEVAARLVLEQERQQ